MLLFFLAGLALVHLVAHLVVAFFLAFVHSLYLARCKGFAKFFVVFFSNADNLLAHRKPIQDFLLDFVVGHLAAFLTTGLAILIASCFQFVAIRFIGIRKLLNLGIVELQDAD